MSSDLQSFYSTLSHNPEIFIFSQHPSNLYLNIALGYVAQKIIERLQKPHPFSVDSDNQPLETISNRKITIEHKSEETDSEYKKIIPVEPLSIRELEVLQIIVNGFDNLVIARKLHLTEEIVKSHVHNILRKLCVHDRTQAAIEALCTGLVY
jgi:DNA-binding NarL/FixJ family response regulator